MVSFNSIVSGITISFECPNCGHEVKCEIYSLPSPNWGAESAVDSETSDDEYINCDNCGHEYCADLFMNFYEGNVIVTDLKNNKEVESVSVVEHYEEEDYEDDEDVGEEPEFVN